MRKIYVLLAAFLITLNLSAALNLVTNGTFEESTDGWIQIENEGTHSLVLDGTLPMAGTKSASIAILTSTTTGLIEDSWKQGLGWRMSTVKDARYKVHFKARASKEISLISQFQQNFAPFAPFGEMEWTITTVAKDYEMIVTNEKGVGGNWAFFFYYGHLNVGDKLWIDDVVIEELVNETTNKLTDGNICNGDFEADVPNSGADLIAGGWRTFNADPAKTTFAIDNTTPISGTRSFKGTSITAGTAGWHSQIIWNFYPVVGQKYSIEFKAKATENVGIVVEGIDDWPERPNSMAFLNFDVTTALTTFKANFGVEATEYDNYTLIFWLGNLSAGKSIWLDDIKLYQTNLQTGVKIPFDDDDNTSIRMQGNNIHVSSAKAGIVNIYNMQGQRIISRNIKAGDNLIPCKNGVYVAQVIVGNRVLKSAKVIMQE
jgi:hypothetical protein